MQPPIYLDYHATTPVDPRVLEAMLPFFTQQFGNAGSTTHSFGHDAKAALDQSREVIAAGIGCSPREIVFTSGATESNNLALRGLCERARRRGNHLVSATTEHKAVLDPLRRLARKGLEVTLLGVEQAGSPVAGLLRPEQVAQVLRDDTLVVSVMLANNEIGVIQDLAAISAVCREKGVLLHCDATQAVGKIPVHVEQFGVNLMSFSAHKIYGPKGVGALYVRRGSPHVRLEPLIDGGGQEGGLRSGTANVPGIVGFAKALELCLAELDAESIRLTALRESLWNGLRRELPDVVLNGPDWNQRDVSGTNSLVRLPGNLNCAFPFVNGEALLMNMKDVAVSSGSACTSANPEPSHVLRALGLSEDLTRASLRFGLGRFTTEEEINFAINSTVATVRRLRQMSSLAGA